MTRGIIALVFRCQITGGDLTTTDYNWATAAAVSELADGAYAIRVRNALEDGQPPAIRAHDGRQLV